MSSVWVGRSCRLERESTASVERWRRAWLNDVSGSSEDRLEGDGGGDTSIWELKWLIDTATGSPTQRLTDWMLKRINLSDRQTDHNRQSQSRGSNAFQDTNSASTNNHNLRAFWVTSVRWQYVADIKPWSITSIPKPQRRFWGSSDKWVGARGNKLTKPSQLTTSSGNGRRRDSKRATTILLEDYTPLHDSKWRSLRRSPEKTGSLEWCRICVE